MQYVLKYFNNLIMQDENRDQVWVLNNKQGFQDCEAYAELEDWLGVNATKYWDDNFDRIDLVFLNFLKSEIFTIYLFIFFIFKTRIL